MQGNPLPGNQEGAMYSRKRSIFLFSILLLLICLGFLLFLAGCGTSSASSSAQTNVSDSAVSTLKIETQWRATMTVGQSDDITLDLSSSLTVSPPGEEHTAIVSQPTPVGTPNVPVGQAFGPGYQPLNAVGDLEAPDFDITPAAIETQALAQPDVQFLWTVSPQSAGPQVIYVTLTGQWQPTNGGGIIERTLGEIRLDIQVQNPPPPQSGLDPGIVAAIIGAVATVVAALIGALVIWMQVSKDKQKKRQAKHAHGAAHPAKKPAHTPKPPPPE
jgi:hypothetical protein